VLRDITRQVEMEDDACGACFEFVLKDFRGE
jgi:hypothetical protein